MEKLEKYRQYVKNFLVNYSQTNKPAIGDIEVQTIFDEERDHYQIVYIGWKQQRWIHSCPIHIDIKGEKIWIQWNGTEIDIPEEFVGMGVPKSDIVIGFYPEKFRQFSDYGVS
jgi:hypothetical protein